ncbi:hypothetical protein OCOL_000706 [Ordospora colligata]
MLVLMAYACTESLTKDHFRFVKIIFVPILVGLTMVEFGISIINQINGEESESDENVESDDGYVKLDMFSGWPLILINVAAIISVFELCLLFYFHDDVDDVNRSNLRFQLALFSAFVPIDNLIRCAYSIMMKCRVRKSIKYVTYVLVGIDILLILGLIGLFAWCIKKIGTI